MPQVWALVRSSSVALPLHAPPPLSQRLLSLHFSSWTVSLCSPLLFSLLNPSPVHQSTTFISTTLDQYTMQPNHYDLLGQVRNDSRRMTREDYQPLRENALQSRSPSCATPARTEGMLPIYSSWLCPCFGLFDFDFIAHHVHSLESV